jgi:uncharacterized protein (UPF0332 family)
MNERVARHLSKAEEALADARILQAAGRGAGVVSRAYYAMFHAAEALLASLDLEFSSHQAVIGAFGREFAKTQVLDPKFHRYLRLAFDERQTADYDEAVELTAHQASRAVAAADELIAVARQHLASPQ